MEISTSFELFESFQLRNAASLVFGTLSIASWNARRHSSVGRKQASDAAQPSDQSRDAIPTTQDKRKQVARDQQQQDFMNNCSGNPAGFASSSDGML
jgi:hypothetical protein